jgi:hypothetical protein
MRNAKSNRKMLWSLFYHDAGSKCHNGHFQASSEHEPPTHHLVVCSEKFIIEK